MGRISLRGMVDQVKFILGFILGIVFIIGLAWILPNSEGRYYDCGMAEWHPDIPKEVKEACRKKHLDQFRRQQELKGITT